MILVYAPGTQSHQASELEVGFPISSNPAPRAGFRAKRLMGFEPTTFCMASRACGYADCLDIPANERIHGRQQLAAIPDFHREITGVWGLKAD